MATTKFFKRANAKDVFDEVTAQDEPVGSETSSTVSETAESTPELDNDKTPESLNRLADDTDDTDDTDDDESAAIPVRRRWLRRVLVAAVGGFFIAALAASGLFAWQLKQHTDTASAGRAALATAQRYAVVLTSIDPNNIDRNFTEVLDGATGEFKDMYSQSASQLRQALIDNKAGSKGIVVDSAIKSVTKTKVEVLLFIDQSISNTVNPGPRIDRSRVAITMELVDNRWLASSVEIK